MAKNNAFDDLLAAMKDDNHRKALAEIAEKEPTLKEAVMLRSDYSRNLDEFKKKEEELTKRAEFANTYESWWKENYDAERKGTKRELAAMERAEQLQKTVEDLEQRVQAGGDMTFDELNKHIDRISQERGFAVKGDLEAIRKDLDSKASGAQTYIDTNLVGYAHIATKAPRLAVRHYSKFNEELDVDGLIDHAAKNGFKDLEKAYEDFVSPKVREREAKEFESKLEEAKKAGRDEALKEKGMSAGSMPVDNNPPTMGHFQRKILGIKEGADGSTQVPDNAELGSGAFSAAAARNWDREGS